MRRWGILFISCLCLVLLVACGEKTTYTRTATAADVTEAVAAALGDASSYTLADQDVYTFYFGEEGAYSLTDDCRIRYHEDTLNVNEFGVFRVAKEEDTGAVVDMVQKYVDGQVSYLKGFVDTYSPQETAKIDHAQVLSRGCYVFYSILSEKDTATAVKALEECITK